MSGELKLGVLALLEAQTGKGEALAAFLEGGRALAAAEEGTATWYAFRIGDTTFGIFDTFETEAARRAHLGGEIPRALGQVASDLLASEPDIRTVDLIAALDPRPGLRIEQHAGPRAELRSLFELAEDSAAQLDSYIDTGRVLVARDGLRFLGHLQLIETADPAEAEVKNMAVLESRQRQGIGRALMEAAIALVRDEGRSRLLVATATADTGNLRFYQRQGFRLRSIERDVFTEATGYEPNLHLDGIELRDQVWLDLPLQQKR
jgi:GNAT superfamily N-acetyltransferase